MSPWDAKSNNRRDPSDCSLAGFPGPMVSPTDDKVIVLGDSSMVDGWVTVTVAVALIEPDFNVLPLIAKHFKSRYADQQFLIFDQKRSYGIFYDLERVEFVTLDFDDQQLKEALHQEEKHYDKMWQDYFVSTGIKNRINKNM